MSFKDILSKARLVESDSTDQPAKPTGAQSIIISNPAIEVHHGLSGLSAKTYVYSPDNGPVDETIYNGILRATSVNASTPGLLKHSEFLRSLHDAGLDNKTCLKAAMKLCIDHGITQEQIKDDIDRLFKSLDGEHARADSNLNNATVECVQQIKEFDEQIKDLTAKRLNTGNVLRGYQAKQAAVANSVDRRKHELEQIKSSFEELGD